MKDFDYILDQFHLNEIIKLLKDLIILESHQEAEGYERDVALYICDSLKNEGISVSMQAVIEERYNIIAEIHGENEGPRILFNGHTDTIPPYGMVDAFSPYIKDGKIYGRGSVDMKGGLAAVIATMIAIKRSEIKFSGSLLLAATVGEESYSPGAYKFVNESNILADYAIVAEPTEMKVITAHKGVFWGEARFTGKAVHGSIPSSGINAIYKASRWIQEIQNNYIPELSKRLHTMLGSPTINIGVIQGGTRPVIVPDLCTIAFERRMIPGETKEEVLSELLYMLNQMTLVDPELKGEITMLPVFKEVPHDAMETDPNNILVMNLCKIYEEEFGVYCKPSGLNGWTDAALISLMPGVKVVVCGPGSIEQAHTDDEFISITQLEKAYRTYLKLFYKLCVE